MDCDTRNELVYNELVYCFDVQKILPDGIIYFNQLIDNDPYNYLAWFALGQSYNLQNQYDKAKDAFDYSVTINDKFSSGWYNLGLSQMNLDEFVEAKESFTNTLKFEVPSAEVLTHLGAAHEKLEEFADAYKFYKKPQNSMNFGMMPGLGWLLFFMSRKNIWNRYIL